MNSLKSLNTDSIPVNLEEKKNWIKYQLKIRNISFSKLARTNNISKQVFSLALKQPYPTVELIIARALSLEPCDIWPERYKNGIPVKHLKSKIEE